MTIYNNMFENSSMLLEVSYDSETMEMSVVFSGGKKYIYEDVDKSIFDGLISAESAGKYFNSIKGTLKIKRPE